MKHILTTAALLATAACLSAARPNIVVIMTDDVGWSDLGCMGGEIRTPNLDALAEKGLRFTHFYNTARCCPTRASLLTGLYSHRAGIGHMVEDRGRDGYRGDLNAHCVTIAEVLRPAGYRTYAVGKWHVTGHVKPEGPKDNWPLQRGFDRYYGTIRGAGSYFDPSTLTRDNTAVSAFADSDYRPAQYYYTDAITDHAVRFLQEHQRHTPEKPFFLYVAYTAAHWPLHALPDDIARQQGRYDNGYKPVIAARLSKQKSLGLITPDWAATPEVGEWESLDTKRWEAACMEVYAAQVECMDRGVGRIVEQLTQDGQIHNTLLLYLQDNGACAESQGRNANAQHPDVRPDKPSFPAMAPGDLQPPVSTPLQTREGFPVLMGRKELPGPVDTHMAYGEAWAHVSNTPFREYKKRVHEGGIATPLIAHWPEGIPAGRRGRLESQPGHVIDIMATCVDLAGATYPSERMGEKVHPPAGVSLVPALNGEPLNRREALFWEHEGNRAVRDGRWKLVAKGPAGAWELYDLESDRTEMTDLASQRPELVRKLAAQWEAWGRSNEVLPWIWEPAHASTTSTVPAAGRSKSANAESGSRAERQPGDLRFSPDPALPNVLLLGDSISIESELKPPGQAADVTVACYYFGNYHPGDARNTRLKGKDWSEWELVKAAKPRFPGHAQPKVPLWGYTDESDPKVMAQKIAAAADHGIDAFIFDWYYYNDGPFLERPIDIGFLQATNNHRIKFGFMWANHDWVDIHPYKRGTPQKVLYPGAVTPTNFAQIGDRLIQKYFQHPSYWRIEGKPYLSFYDLSKLVEGFGSVQATRAGLEALRARARAAGLPGLHLNAVVWGRTILPGEQVPADPVKLVQDLGFDSITSYVWIHHVPLPELETDYNHVRDAYFKYWDGARRKYDVPYFPNVTMGWDSSPRAHQEDAFGNFGYPFMNTISGNTPERFREALQQARERLLAEPAGPRILNINCWNEWTEGSYLEPDTVHGMKYLEAVRDVFGSTP